MALQDNSIPRSLDPSSFGSLIRYAVFHRWWARGLILFLALVSALFGLLTPLFQKVFVDELLGAAPMDAVSSALPWVYALSPVVLVISAFFTALVSQGLSLLANYIGARESIILQKEFSETMYRKTLAIRADSMSGSTVGEIVSIYATDVPGSTAIIDQALPMGAGILFPIAFAPVAILWLTGIPVWATWIVILVIVTLMFSLAVRQSRFFYRFKQLAAERTGLVNEWVQNMRLLRILNWIESYETKIFRKREEETRNRVAMVTNGQLMGTFGSSISFVINLTGVASLVFMKGGAVSPGELFALLWIFGVFLSRPFRQIPWIFTFSFDSLTSIRRLERFLARPSDANDMKIDEEVRATRRIGSEAFDLKVRNLNLEIGGQKLLSGIDLDVKAGEFVAVVGEVGSGKSLLMLSLVAETGATFDEFKIGSLDAMEADLSTRRRHFSYVAQEGFVMSGTLRENVVFQYDVPARLDSGVVNSLARAQFRIESETLEDGLDTEIGERGVNLSGGQRQRVSLARAHQFERPIILLDDCLSAVDVDTESQLVRDLIDGSWKNHTRILVTHRLSVLERVDRVLFMENGRIVEQGAFRDLLATSARVREYVSSVRKSEVAEPAEERRKDGQAESVS